MPQTWSGVAGTVIVLGLAGAARTRRWSVTHTAIVGAGRLLLTAVQAFTYDPMIGEVTTQAKYAHNATMVAIVLAAVAVALFRRPRTDDPVVVPERRDVARTLDR